MKTLKPLFLIPAGLSLLLAGGCSQDTKAADAANKFFEAYNHLCEEDGIEANGKIELLGQSAEYTAAFTSEPQQLAISAFLNDGQAVGFYIKDGKTYLDFLGTKSSSEANKIGIDPNEPFHLPNPFLELSKEERANLFENVQVSEDTYTFTIKNSEMDKFLDNYGAAKVNSAKLQATIKEGKITWMSIDVQGRYDIVSDSADLSLAANATITQTGKNVLVDYPADLSPETWNAVAPAGQDELFSEAIDQADAALNGSSEGNS